jgi:hypothetical protein
MSKPVSGHHQGKIQGISRLLELMTRMSALNIAQIQHSNRTIPYAHEQVNKTRYQRISGRPARNFSCSGNSRIISDDAGDGVQRTNSSHHDDDALARQARLGASTRSGAARPAAGATEGVIFEFHFGKLSFLLRNSLMSGTSRSTCARMNLVALFGLELVNGCIPLDCRVSTNRS